MRKVVCQRLRPRTAHDAAHRAVVLEGQNDAVHRHVTEHHKKCSHWNQHDVQLPVSIDAAADDEIAQPPVPWNDRSGSLLQAQQSFHSKIGPAAKVIYPPPYIFLLLYSSFQPLSTIFLYTIHFVQFLRGNMRHNLHNSTQSFLDRHLYATLINCRTVRGRRRRAIPAGSTGTMNRAKQTGNAGAERSKVLRPFVWDR